jgi:hypothetical protein
VTRLFENDRMRWLGHTATGLGLAVALTLATGGQAQAATWQQARRLEANAGEAPVLAVDPRGDAIAVWPDQVDSKSDAPTVLSVVQRIGGHAFGKVVHFHRSRSGAAVAAPSVALAPSGAAVISWFDGDAFRVSIRRSLKGRFGSVHTLASGSTLDNPLVAIDSRGRAVVAWSIGRAGHRRVVTRSSNLSGRFGSAVSVSGRGDAVPSSLAVDARGDAAIGWAYQPLCTAHTPAVAPSGGREAVRLRRAGAASFGPASTWPGVRPTVGVADNGRVTVVSDDERISCSTQGTPLFQRGQALVRSGSVSTGINGSPLVTGLTNDAAAIAHNGTLAIVGTKPAADPESGGPEMLLTRTPSGASLVRALPSDAENFGPVSIDPLATAVLSAQTPDFLALGLVATPRAVGPFVQEAGDRENEGAATGIDDAGRATIVLIDDGDNIVAATYG